MSERIGFMQGRLSPMVGGRIQAFPWDNWRNEFPAAEQLGLRLMEWTLDHERLHENPLLTPAGRAEIRALSAKHDVTIPSLTGDCFMQAPFWKSTGTGREALIDELRDVTRACGAVGITTIVVPLVDNGRLENRAQEDDLVETLESLAAFFDESAMMIVFESDYQPAELARLMRRLDAIRFGINYDIGNSAAAGLDVDDELAEYGDRITNVHMKDRVLGGTTVPLGTGNADFAKVFAALGRIGFSGTYILQTARAADGDHAGVLGRYRDMTTELIAKHGA